MIQRFESERVLTVSQ